MPEDRRHRDRGNLRAELEGALGHPISAGQWAWMVHEDGCVEEALAFPEGKRRRVVLESWHRLQQEEAADRARAKQDSAGSAPERALWLAAAEVARAVATSEVLALSATSLPGVREFRDEFLGGERVEEANARKLLAEAAWERAPILRELADALALLYGWNAEDAALFVLTGIIPHVVPLTAVVERFDAQDEQNPGCLRTRATITLQAEPWVSDETISVAYRALQRDVMGKGRKPVKTRELALVRFVARHLTANGGPDRPWAELAREWNVQHGDDGWGYTNPYNLKPAYERARARLLNDDYRIPGTGQEEPRPEGVVRQGTLTYRAFLDEDIHGTFIWSRPPSGDRDGYDDGNLDGNR